MAEQNLAALQHTLGALKAAMEFHKEEDKAIKAQLDQVSNDINIIKLDQQGRHNELKIELSKIASVIEQEQHRWTSFERKQSEHNELITDIKTDITTINNNIKTLTESIQTTTDQFKELDHRVKRLERWTYVIYGIVATLVALGTFIAHVAHTAVSIKEMNEYTHGKFTQATVPQGIVE